MTFDVLRLIGCAAHVVRRLCPLLSRQWSGLGLVSFGFCIYSFLPLGSAPIDPLGEQMSADAPSLAPQDASSPLIHPSDRYTIDGECEYYRGGDGKSIECRSCTRTTRCDDRVARDQHTQTATGATSEHTHGRAVWCSIGGARRRRVRVSQKVKSVPIARTRTTHRRRHCATCVQEIDMGVANSPMYRPCVCTLCACRSEVGSARERSKKWHNWRVDTAA
jgi:hypothetical protein